MVVLTRSFSDQHFVFKCSFKTLSAEGKWIEIGVISHVNNLVYSVYQ